MKVIDTRSIDLNLLNCQYNPDRFKYWQKCSAAPDEINILKLQYSPHLTLLNTYKSIGIAIINSIRGTSYYKMQQLYGRDYNWIKRKILKFINLYKDIKCNGFKGHIEVLRQPMHKNKYNSSYEIYEGHHRAAIYYALNEKSIPSHIIKL